MARSKEHKPFIVDLAPPEGLPAAKSGVYAEFREANRQFAPLGHPLDGRAHCPPKAPESPAILPKPGDLGNALFLTWKRCGGCSMGQGRHLLMESLDPEDVPGRHVVSGGGTYPFSASRRNRSKRPKPRPDWGTCLAGHARSGLAASVAKSSSLVRQLRNACGLKPPCHFIAPIACRPLVPSTRRA